MCKCIKINKTYFFFQDKDGKVNLEEYIGDMYRGEKVSKTI